MPPVARQPLSAYEVVLVVTVFAGWFIYGSVDAVIAGFPVPRFSDNEALGLVLVECFTFPIALAVLWARGWRLTDLGIRVTWYDSLHGLILFGAAFLVTSVLWDTLGRVVGGREFLDQFAQSVSVSLTTAILVSVVNGIFEEFFLCRYLIEAFARWGPAVALGVSALVRTMYHLYQGPLGAILVLAFGVVVSLFYWRFRQVWPVMLAHIAADLFALA